MRIASRSDYPLSLAAALVAIAAALSGPIGFAITFVRPQPPWTDAGAFIANAHPLQQIPYWLGFVLLLACLLFVARAAALAFDEHRTRAILAAMLTAMYGAIIAINYALQTVYLPQLVRDHDPVVTYVTMANGRAPTWVLEMFGYGLLGIATWVLAPVFGSTGVGGWIRRLFVANGVISVFGAVVIAGNLGWVMTVPGLVAYLAWNVLFVVMMTVVAFAYRPRRAASVGRASRAS